MIEYTLKLNSQQIVNVLKAIDLLMRIKINQPEEISRDLLEGMYDHIGVDEVCKRRDKANEYLRLAFLEIFPTWDEVEKMIRVANRICPKCGNPNYMTIIESQKYPYKCINCNSYFTDDDFYVGKHEKKERKDDGQGEDR